MIFAVAFINGKIIDARNAEPHQAMLIEFPVFVAVAAEPISAVVMTFIGKTYGDAVLAEGPDFLDQESSSRFHLRVRNASIALRPCRNSARFRHRLSVV